MIGEDYLYVQILVMPCIAVMRMLVARKLLR